MKPIAILKRCKPLFSLLILVILFLIIKERLSELSYQQIILSLSAIQKQNIFLAITYTLVGYFVIATYDLVALRHLNYKLDRFKVGWWWNSLLFLQLLWCPQSDYCSSDFNEQF